MSNAFQGTGGADVSHINVEPGLLAGKVAVVLGASRGIGATTARVFARAGAAVVLAARDEAALAIIVRDIQQSGGRALAVPTDIGEAAAVERLIRRTLDVYGRLDVAFNNAAGGPKPAPLAEISLEGFDEAVRVNLRGVFLAMKYEIPAMLAGGGAIVNMSSTAGLSGVQGMSGYVAGKHGIVGMTKSAALDYAAQGVRVNAVAPGPILTERLSSLPEEYRAPVIAAVPMRRIGSPEEVGALAAWLCSDQASFLTGAVVPIDGGRMAAGA
jgi:NAD(P)-dependent dehydrogenase (short-subunit alcohol dehydrogenase family)